MPNELSAAFKCDGTAVLNETPTSNNQSPLADLPYPSEQTPQGESPEQVIDPALAAISEESTPGTQRMQIFFILGAVQTLPVWILTDSDSVHNFIDEAAYNRLPTSLQFEATET